MRRALPAVLAALLAAGLSGTAAPAAFGHAAFAGASPPPGQRVESAPARVTMTFTEPLRRELSEATLLDAGGRRVPAALSVRGRRMALSPEAELEPGAYRVRWRTVSTEDAHPLEGSFGFGVRAAAAGGAGALEESPLAGGGWARALARGLLYAALLLFAGALLCRALLGRAWPASGEPPPLAPRDAAPPGAGPGDGGGGGGVATLARPRAVVAVDAAAGARRRADALLVDAGLAAVALAAVAAVVDAADAAGGLSVEGLRAYLLSGTPGVARVALVGLLAAALALARRAPRAAAVAALAGLGCVVASGHANSAEPRGVAIAADRTHLVAGAVWLGGAGTLLAAWSPWLRDPGARGAAARDALPRFGRVALPAFLAVAAAGTVNAVVELSAVGDLWDTGYGRVLAAKVALVAAAATAAWWHAYRRPRRRDPGAARRDRPSAAATSRALRAEVGLGVGVVLAAGLLVAFPLPPRQLEAAGGGGVAIPACDPCPLPPPAPDELGVAGQAGSHVVAGWLRRERGGLAGTIRTFDSRGRPGTGAIEIPGAGVRPCGRGCVGFRTAPAPRALLVDVAEGGRVHTARLPATWRAGEAARARRLLDRAQRTMRALRSVREHEVVTSGPGTRAVTRYRLKAPDRMAFVTGAGVRTIQIGRRQWLKTPESPWRRGEVPGGAPFRTRSWFRWTPYARGIQLLADRGDTVELALADPATPVWMRLVVERSTGRVLRERIAARARFIVRRFHAFDAPLEIRPPRGAADAG